MFIYNLQDCNITVQEAIITERKILPNMMAQVRISTTGPFLMYLKVFLMTCLDSYFFIQDNFTRFQTLSFQKLCIWDVNCSTVTSNIV